MKLAMVIYKVNQEINVPILHSRHWQNMRVIRNSQTGEKWN
jgi:hypothetical protein